MTTVERALRVRCTGKTKAGWQCKAWSVRGTDLCVAHGQGAPSVPRSWALRCHAHRSDGQACQAWAVRGARICRVHGGMAPVVRAAAERRWDNLLVFERAIRRHATRLRDQHIAHAALRAWIGAVIGRQPAEHGMAFLADQFDAQAIAGGPPTDQQLAPHRVAASDTIPLEQVVAAVASELASIRETLAARS